MIHEVITIHTDGGCSGNPGPGAWAWVLEQGGKVTERSGFCPVTTNNRMELTAVIDALTFAEGLASSTGGKPCVINLHTDSRYVQQGISSWIKKWVKNNWLTANREPVKNQDLWKNLLALDASLKVTWHWVRGHVGNELNEACDALVQQEIKKNRP
ncbi:MAG: ribonuclease HI [Spirochaetales bacterium]|nr:MAG: ribonuclease HI [Spirochaetales bacterium]